MREHYEQPGFSIGALEYEGVPAYVSPAPPVAAREGADRNPELRSRCGTRRRRVLTAFVANDEELRA